MANWFTKLFKKGETVDSIVSDFTAKAERLAAVAASKDAEIVSNKNTIEELTQASLVADAEGQRARAIKAKIEALVTF